MLRVESLLLILFGVIEAHHFDLMLKTTLIFSPASGGLLVLSLFITTAICPHAPQDIHS